MGDVSVLDHGAVGDGVVDDRPSIQRAINSLLPDGGFVRFPAVTAGGRRARYLLGDTVNVWSGCVLLGEGRKSRRPTSIAREPGGPNTMFECKDAPGSSGRARDISFSNLKFELSVGRPDVRVLRSGDRDEGNFRTAIKASPFAGLRVSACHFAWIGLDEIDYRGFTNMAVLAMDGEDLYVTRCVMDQMQIKCGGGQGGISHVWIEDCVSRRAYNYAVSVVGNHEGSTIDHVVILRNRMSDLREGGVLLGDDAGGADPSKAPVSMRNVYIAQNVMDGGWLDQPTSDERGRPIPGGQPKGICVRPAASNQAICILDNVMKPESTARGSFGVYFEPRRRPSIQTTERLLVERNTVRNLDKHGIHVAGSVEGLRIVGNRVRNTDGVLVRGLPGAAPRGRLTDNVTSPAPSGPRNRVVLDATLGDVGPLALADVPPAVLEIREGSGSRVLII